MSKRVAIVQSNYIPWKGYFDLIRNVDEFILLDDLQYTRRDWRNRNKIKTPSGLAWLTIPVESKGKYAQLIKDTRVSDPQWNKKHWDTIVHNYAAAPHFGEYRRFFEELYLQCHEPYLSQVNFRFLSAICQLLRIQTKLSWSMDYDFTAGKTERLISLCQQAGADMYLSGPSAKVYLDEGLFAAVQIRLQWMDYSGYAEYHQLYPPFEHGVSIIDLIMNEGPDAPKYLKSL